jgi:orotidine-5'-phosphate decarboxylase
MKKTIFIALDTNEQVDKVILIAKEIKTIFNEQAQAANLQNKFSIGFKLGLEFFCKQGFYGVNKIEELDCDVFLDLKFFDISNTVCGAYKSLCLSSIGKITHTTVHLLNGTACLQTLHDFKLNLDLKLKPKILGVSILTSLDMEYLKNCNFNFKSVDEAVAHLVSINQKYVAGCICSPLEIKSVRSITNKNFEVVTPGIQITSLNNDQKRTATPNEAFTRGSSSIVIGRAITEAQDKILAIKDLIANLKLSE